MTTKKKTNRTKNPIVQEGVSDALRKAARRGFIRGAARHIGRKTAPLAGAAAGSAIGSATNYVIHGSESAGEGTLHYVVHKKLDKKHETKKQRQHANEGLEIHAPWVAGAALGIAATHYGRKYYKKKKQEKKKPSVAEGTIGNAIAGVSDDIALALYAHGKRMFISADDKKKDKKLKQKPSAQPMEIQANPQITREGFVSSASNMVRKVAKNKLARGTGAFVAAAAISSPFMNASQSATEKYLKHRDKMQARKKQSQTPETVTQAANSMQYEGFVSSLAMKAAPKIAQAASFLKKHKSQIKMAGKFTAGQAISGAVAGATIPILDRYLSQKDQQQQQQQASQGLKTATIKKAPTKTAHVTEATLKKEPPVVLILKRKSIRLFPQGDKVALYKNEKTGISFAVPYDDESDGVTSNNTIVGAVSENWVSNLAKSGWRSFRIFAAQKSKNRGPFTYSANDAKKDAEEVRRNKEAAERAYAKFHQATPGLRRLPRGSGRAALYGVTGAVGTGYVTKKFIDAVQRRYLNNPDSTREVDGRPLYVDEGARDVVDAIDLPNYKGTLKTGAIIGGSFMLGKAAYDTTHTYLSRRMKHGKELKDLQKKNTEYIKRHRMRSEEIEKLDEFLPGLVAGAARLLPAASRLVKPASSALSKAKTILTSPTAKTAYKATSVAGTVGGVAGAAKAVVDKNKADNNEITTESTKTPTNPFKAKLGKYFSKDIRKHLAIAAAGALGAKAVDIAYDAYRDRKEVKKVEKEEKVKAKVRRQYAPRKQVITRIEKPRGTTIVKKEINEAKQNKYLGYNGIQNILDNKQHGYVYHADGTKTHVDGFTAGMIKNVHDALSNENQEKLRRMVAKDKTSFMKIAQFSMKQHNK